MRRYEDARRSRIAFVQSPGNFPGFFLACTGDGERLVMKPLSQAIIAEARTWIGTPYRHQASLKGVGCDCLGLLRGVWRAIHGVEPEMTPAYAPDWAEAGGEERLAAAARRHLTEIDPEDAEPAICALIPLASASAAKPRRFSPRPPHDPAYEGAAVANLLRSVLCTSRRICLRFPAPAS